MNTLKRIKVLVAIVCLFFISQVKAQNTNPEPMSGNELTKDFIAANLIYPEEELNSKTNGKVVVTLHIDKNGKGSNYQIKSSFSEAASPIALDLVKKIIWKPATYIAMPVESDFEYEIDFNAKSYNRYWKNMSALPLLWLWKPTTVMKSSRTSNLRNMPSLISPMAAAWVSTYMATCNFPQRLRKGKSKAR